MLTLTPSKTLSDEPICSHTCSMDHLMISQYWRKSADTTYFVQQTPSPSQVAITLGYRHQPGAGAPIDAGNRVADNGKVEGYRYYSECLFGLFAGGQIRSRVV